MHAISQIFFLPPPPDRYLLRRKDYSHHQITAGKKYFLACAKISERKFLPAEKISRRKYSGRKYVGKKFLEVEIFPEGKLACGSCQSQLQTDSRQRNLAFILPQRRASLDSPHVTCNVIPSSMLTSQLKSSPNWPDFSLAARLHNYLLLKALVSAHPMDDVGRPGRGLSVREKLFPDMILSHKYLAKTHLFLPKT